MPTDARLAALRRAVADPLPHPGLAELRSAADAIQDWAFRHYQTLPEQSIGLTATPADLAARLDRPPPEIGRPFADVLADFREHIEPFAFRVNHPRFLAFIPGAPSFPSVLGDWLAAAANFFVSVWLEGAGPAQVEMTVLGWFRDWLGLPATTRGILTGGGSEANLTALVVAREQIPFEDRGRMVLYTADQRHWSIDRAAKVMGLRPAQIRLVPVDSELRLRGPELARSIARDRTAGLLPWAVVANAGTTHTGTVDPLTEIAAVCRSENLWLHVDAAYGWAVVLTEEGRRELAGIGEGDSVTLDPHKWLAQTFDVGCVLVRDGRRLPETFATRPDYLKDVISGAEDEISFADYGIALSRRFRALKVWLSIQVLGLDWFRHLVAHCCGLANYAQARLESSGSFEILCPRRLSIVCFRFVPSGAGDLDAVNSRLLAALRQTGRAFLSSTRVRGQLAIRMCFINWRTTAADVDEVVDLLVRLGREVANVPDVPAVSGGGRPGTGTPT
jgi:aromatic-L-amino-acid/L-tryptophan decarboxylase